ncbi:hypothetical protein KJ586_02455 [Patescibacteria group bacterium]|nr:hypothetical protein [Patescibacteria group bacterium]MBU4347491.1 hypothetical protein [Patescibacteria group bacterium]MBU4455347.1 hypothetical protein [Patescibacteria group bacterium]MCG2690506.1 hypothetical protein [Candidatus Parcubacteria bacterium]
MNKITLPRLNDLHAHLREKKLMKAIIRLFNVCGWVVAMGNLEENIASGEDVEAYKDEISGYNPLFAPIFTVMFIRSMTPNKLRVAYMAGARILKLIPGGASTNSDECIKLDELPKYYNVLRAARELGMIFSIHLELAIDPIAKIEINRIYREVCAIPYLKNLIEKVPNLKIVVEHISTTELLEVVLSAPDNVFGTATAHHCVLSKLDLYDGGRRNPHLLCNPILKSPMDAESIIRQINDPYNTKIGFGSDCAAHWKYLKESDNPPCGIFSPPPIAVPLIIQKSQELGILNISALNNFFCRNGEQYYSLPPTTQSVVLEKKPWQVTREYMGIVPLWAGKILSWRITSPKNNFAGILAAK